MDITTTGYYGTKDANKAARANKFIGRGAPNSSTESYRRQLGPLANCGTYTASDTVFVSVNGNRPGAIPFDQAELTLAIEAKATIITDTLFDRQRQYNTGERNVAAFLTAHNYCETNPGTWVSI